MLLKVEDACLKIKNKIIFNNINLIIQQKDAIAIIGPNGGGKTSFVKALIGISRLTSGKIQKNNIKISYMPQSINITPSLPISAYQFLSLGCKTINKENVLIKYIANLLHKQLHQLSGGEMQLLLFINALINKSDLIILDEPTNSMDIATKDSFHILMSDLFKSSPRAIIIISHDLEIASKYTKEIICMNRHFCYRGKTSAIIDRQKINNIYDESFIKEMNHHLKNYH